MSVEQQVFDLVESGARAAPEITHTLSTMGDGRMIQGIKKVWEAGINVGMNQGFWLGIKASKNAGLRNGIAIGVVVGVISGAVGYHIGAKRCKGRQECTAKDAAALADTEEMQFMEPDIPNTELPNGVVPKDGTVEPRGLQELTEQQISVTD